MKKFVVYSIIILAIITLFIQKEFIKKYCFYIPKALNYEVTMKRDILCLMAAYPEYIINIEKDKDKNVYLIMKSGNRILYDDKRIKSFEEKLQNPDLQDMMEQVYPLSDINGIMPKDFDPGRIRIYSLFKEVYGGSKEQIQSNLTAVSVGYKKYQFNKNNNAADSLRSAMNDLVSISKTNGSINSFLFPASGTFNYRIISGTNRLSPHSFGTAIDLKSDKFDYWKWATKEQGEKRLASYPRDIVKVFERNNFVWGGKWNHFDILHFEYRPEIILKGRYFANNSYFNNKPWYYGIPFEDDKMSNYINIIDKELKDNDSE